MCCCGEENESKADARWWNSLRKRQLNDECSFILLPTYLPTNFFHTVPCILTRKITQTKAAKLRKGIQFRSFFPVTITINQQPDTYSDMSWTIYSSSFRSLKVNQTKPEDPSFSYLKNSRVCVSSNTHPQRRRKTTN